MPIDVNLDPGIRMRNEAQQRRYLEAAIARFIRPIVSTYANKKKHIVRGWSKETKPQFEPHAQLNGWTVEAWILMTGPTAYGSDTKTVYEMLDEGTDTRHAHMTWPYQSRTQTGGMKYKTRAKIGKLNYVSKKAPERPGIEGRGWEKEIAEDMAEDIDRVMKIILDNGVFL